MGNSHNIHYCVGAFAVLTMVVALAAQELTIPERVARGATGRFSNIPSGKPPSVSDVLSRTDLIVRGIVGDSHGYLSDDLMEVDMDYELKNPVILYDAESTPVARPAAARSLLH